MYETSTPYGKFSEISLQSTKIQSKSTLLLIYLPKFVEKLIKFDIKARTRKTFLINFFDTTFWSVQKNVYALLLLIKKIKRSKNKSFKLKGHLKKGKFASMN